MQTIRILLVEDHLLVREGLRSLVEKEEDMEIIGETSSGDQAVDLAGSLSPDLILMDVSLEGTDGINATRTIRLKYPGIAVLILSAYDNEEFILAALEAKASGYLLKDIGSDELLEAIRLVHRGESVLHPSVTATILKRLKSDQDRHGGGEKGILTERELEIVRCGAEGMVNKEIAYKLKLSERTIQSHWRNIFAKLGVSSRIEAVLRCLREHYIELGDSAE